MPKVRYTLASVRMSACVCSLQAAMRCSSDMLVDRSFVHRPALWHVVDVRGHLLGDAPPFNNCVVNVGAGEQIIPTIRFAVELGETFDVARHLLGCRVCVHDHGSHPARSSACASSHSWRLQPSRSSGSRSSSGLVPWK